MLDTAFQRPRCHDCLLCLMLPAYILRALISSWHLWCYAICHFLYTPYHIFAMLCYCLRSISPEPCLTPLCVACLPASPLALCHLLLPYFAIVAPCCHVVYDAISYYKRLPYYAILPARLQVYYVRLIRHLCFAIITRRTPQMLRRYSSWYSDDYFFRYWCWRCRAPCFHFFLLMSPVCFTASALFFHFVYLLFRYSIC